MNKEDFKVLKSLSFDKKHHKNKLIIQNIEVILGYARATDKGPELYMNSISNKDFYRADLRRLRKLIKNILPKVELSSFLPYDDQIVLYFHPTTAIADFYNSLSYEDKVDYSCLMHSLNCIYNPWKDDTKNDCTIENYKLNLMFITFNFTFSNKEEFYGKQN